MTPRVRPRLIARTVRKVGGSANCVQEAGCIGTCIITWSIGAGSPQQIAARLREMYPDNPSQRVSHETIYAAIYTRPRGGWEPAMIEALRQQRPTRGATRGTLAR